ncbi:MAG TPA: hypothetical protein VMG10_32155 [Gemmataceae bacterium]|nr:hypothetical protein [Gemmataceae bacterium]
MRFPSLVVVASCCLAAGIFTSLQAAEPPASEGGKVRQIKVLADKAPDCSSLKAIVESVTRGCKTNDEKAIAIYNFMQLANYHHAYPSEKGGVGALKEINVYGWSLCGGLHTVEAALWRELGWKWRYVGWSNPGHTTVEASYDGRWHYLDSFLKFYTWMPDPRVPGGRTIAGEEDIKANPALVRDALTFDKARRVYYRKDNRFENLDGKANWRAPAFLVCGDEPEGVISGVRSSNRAGSPTGWGAIRFDSPGYSTDINLSAGSALTLTWDAVPDASWMNGRKHVPYHTCGDKDYRNCPVIGPILEPYLSSGGKGRSYANGTLLFAPELTNDAFLSGLASKDNVKVSDGKLVPVDSDRPASITVELQSPYVMTRASGRADGVDKAEISLDGGKTFKPIRLDDFSEEVGGQYACQVRLSFKTALRAPRLEATVQCNRCALPYLSPGRNKITVHVADPRELGDKRLAITYAYRTGSRSKSYEEMADAGAELARAHYASWSDKPTVVQKVFTAKDLPATFTIDVPTPKGKYPVYPRMLFLRREVLAPGAKPLPLPEGAQSPAPSQPDELKTLPNPFTVGIALPPARTIRPTSKRTLVLRASHAVSLDGQAAENHFLKWKKGETWVMLIGGELKDLPPAADIAAARLIFPVVRGHQKAATKVAVVVLKAPFQPGKAYDFKGLGDEGGSVIVPRQPNTGDYQPPKTFAIDVHRAVKRLAVGEMPFHGFALRVVQDRSVDDGWTVRVDLPKAALIQLELDIYDRK